MTKFEEMIKAGETKIDHSPKGLLDAKIREHIQREGKIIPLEGALGEGPNTTAYVEEVIRNENGTFTKFYGCSYLLKGYPDARLIDSVAVTKRVFMSTIRLIIKNPLPIVFFKKEHIIKWISEIYEADLETKAPPDHELCAPSKELFRVLKLFFPVKFSKCIALFWEDTAYRLRGQDVLGEINKEWLSQNPRKEVLRVLNIGLRRELGIRDKWGMIIKIAKVALLFPGIKSKVVEFTSELNLEKIELDEDDQYFCLNRINYNFMGLDYGQRMEIKNKIDLEKGHVILEI